MRKSYEECITLGNNQTIDDIVNQKHILEESLRHYFSRTCFGEGAVSSDTAIVTNVTVWTKIGVMPRQVVVNGLYEVEGEGFITLVADKLEFGLEDLSLDEQVRLACYLDDTNDGYDK